MESITAYIAGVGTALPGEAVDNAALGAALGVSAEWIDVFVGTTHRHFGRDLATGGVRRTLTDLCAEAGRHALAAAGLDPADIEFLVLATATPDTLLPTTASEVADLLGLDQLPAYQIQAGCSGALQAVELGRALLAAGARAGLVIGGDVTHRHLDLRADAARIPADELVNYVLFGDGAGAAVLTAEPVAEAVAVRGVLHRLVGRGRPAGQRIDWYGVTDRDSERPMLREDYKAIEEGVPALAGEILWELLEQLDWRPADVDYLLPPQLSGRMTERIVKQLAVDGPREVSCVAQTGNTGNALPFLQLEQLLEEMAQGERALVLAVESSKWIKTGLGLERVGSAG
ncbi:3-oxoacyl-ACP synthase III family protein [Streptomyces sp. SP17BM10]|uniref:3-oxoacyl-ACP synthase III family protein n=1 Tax=Streptomyces sp. SP17BM10 TaxID=3002530 RepID=UPI002E79B9EE|nr:3-oxoacyl-ACP synthase III family protein [Streptomyces sp. SP17BM10]MEE1781618.1 3-oxoacyl-ACP synthase III family protein [Streptomyces sp. SP17BM10]